MKEIPLRFQDGQRLLFIGDSITDCGRRGADAPFGNGYVGLLRALVTARHPEARLTWLNRGVNGDTVRDLSRRWEQDAIAPRPDWLSVMIGINDVWGHFLDRPAHAVPLDEYLSTLRALLTSAVTRTGCRLILADPYVIEPDRADPHRALSDGYARAVAGLAAEFSAVHIRTQAAFDRVLTVSAPTAWSGDRIHPDLPGHAVIAQAFLDGLDAAPPRPFAHVTRTSPR